MGDIGKFDVVFADGKKFSPEPPSVEEFDKWLAKQKAIHGEYKVTPEKMVDAPIMSRLSSAAGTVKNLAKTPMLSLGLIARNPAMMGAFIPEAKPMRESDYNSMSDLAGELGGSTAGAITGGGVGLGLAGPPGAIAGAAAGAGIGAVAGDQAAEDWQSKVKGTTPEPRSLGRGLGLFGRNAAGELLGRTAFDVLPAARRWLLRGGAPVDVMQSNIDLLKSMGHPPRLDLVAKGGFFDFGGVYNWVAKNSLASNKINAVANVALRDMRERYKGLLGVNRAGEVVLPDVTSTGRFIERGLKKRDELWYDKANVLYKDFESVFPPNTRIPWTNLSSTLDDLTSQKNSLVKPLVTQRLGNLRETVNQQYGYTLFMPNGSPINIRFDAPFEELKELRSRVGELLGRVDPNPELPRAELKKVYAALSEDLRAGAALEPTGEALRKFDRANNFYSAKMRIVETTLEDFYKKFSAAGGTPAELSATLSGIVNGRDVVKAAHLKAALGKDSIEWDHARKYIFSEMMFPQRAVDGTAGDPNVLYAIRRLSKMDDKMRTVLLGSEGTELRDSMETILEASKRMPGFGSAPVTQYSRFTQAELFGPLNIAAATGAGIATKSLPGGILIFGALSLMTPKLATRLLLNEKVIRNLARGMSAPAVDIGPMLTRLAGDLASMDDDDATALTQFLAGMSGMTNPENYPQTTQQQQQPGNGSIINPSGLTSWQNQQPNGGAGLSFNGSILNPAGQRR
jgi:hypothetical protein